MKTRFLIPILVLLVIPCVLPEPLHGGPQQLTPRPVQAVDIELLEKANASLVVALGLLGANVADGPIDQAVYENSMTIARSMAALCDTGRCDRQARDD